MSKVTNQPYPQYSRTLTPLRHFLRRAPPVGHSISRELITEDIELSLECIMPDCHVVWGECLIDELPLALVHVLIDSIMRAV